MYIFSMVQLDLMLSTTLEALDRICIFEYCYLRVFSYVVNKYNDVKHREWRVCDRGMQSRSKIYTS